MKNETLIVKLNKGFYCQKALEQGIQAYRGLAHFKVKETKQYFETAIQDINSEIKNVIKDEFCNYVLVMMKNVSKSQQNKTR